MEEQASQPLYKETELYREKKDDHYSPYITLVDSPEPSIMMSHGGRCVSMTISDWVTLAWKEVDEPETPEERKEES